MLAAAVGLVAAMAECGKALSEDLLKHRGNTAFCAIACVGAKDLAGGFALSLRGDQMGFDEVNDPCSLIPGLGVTVRVGDQFERRRPLRLGTPRSSVTGTTLGDATWEDFSG